MITRHPRFATLSIFQNRLAQETFNYAYGRTTRRLTAIGILSDIRDRNSDLVYSYLRAYVTFTATEGLRHQGRITGEVAFDANKGSALVEVHASPSLTHTLDSFTNRPFASSEPGKRLHLTLHLTLMPRHSRQLRDHAANFLNRLKHPTLSVPRYVGSDLLTEISDITIASSANDVLSQISSAIEDHHNFSADEIQAIQSLLDDEITLLNSHDEYQKFLRAYPVVSHDH